VDRDEKHVISTLNDQAAKLHEQNNGLNSKVQQLTNVLEKKKKEITELNRIISTMKKSQPTGKEKPGSSGSSMNNTTVNAIPAETTMRPSSAVQKLPDEAQLNDSSLLVVARKYKAR
jgi:ABC-type transporter Mla subunit MlaD